MAALKSCYQKLLCLADQIDTHAEKAPYPHVTEYLRKLAQEKRESAKILRQRIAYLLTDADEPKPTIKSGINHWERMVQDLADQKDLEVSFLQLADLLGEERPEISSLLRELVAAQAPHKERLLDLIARADPQAYQT